MHPSVITSRRAKDELLKIKSVHSTMLQGMEMQSMKVQQFNQQRDQQKAVAMQNEQTMKTELQKSQMVADTEAQKNAISYDLKQSELDIKRVALSSMN